MLFLDTHRHQICLFLLRLKQYRFYDLMIKVAIVGPDFIQGYMVLPYLRRPNGEDSLEYPLKELGEIIHKSLYRY